MGQVIEFKKIESELHPKVIGHRISFYTEEEIDVTLMALNVYGDDKVRYTRDTFKELKLEPLYIKKCLLLMIESGLISVLGVKVINMIIDNIEEITENDYANEI
tara:strand:- start:575 stop:886 length:312 start_codon:yes stop_codon:yes gene_type:complete